jgi:hypothetical protein
MKYIFVQLSILTLLFTACNPFPGPRRVDWKKEWENNQTKLKLLAKDVLEKGSRKYTTGNNDYPSGFDYPFDEGFFISKSFSSTGTVTDTIDTKKITITFYVDRGLLDHYSAFVYTNDSTDIFSYDSKSENGGNDFKIEPNWYMIKD